jgi:hypothetical protein
LAEVLELLYSSETRWRTLKAEGIEWRDLDLLHEAWKRQVVRLQRTGSISTMATGSASDGPLPKETKEFWRLWIAPGLARAQFQVGGDTVDVVFNGPTWWSVGHGVARTNAGQVQHRHGKGWGEALVETRRYIPFLEFHEIERDSVDGRDVLVVRAAPIWSDDFEAQQVLHALIIGDPDEVLLTIDTERGILLQTEARLDSVTYRVVQVTTISFDEELAPEVFKIDPPAGGRWRRVDEGGPTPR